MKYVFDHLQLRTLNKSNVINEILLLFSYKISGAGYGGRSRVQENQNVVLKCGCEEERFVRPGLCRGKAGDAPAGCACGALRCHRPVRLSVS